jgi:hypothetical protein
VLRAGILLGIACAIGCTPQIVRDVDVRDPSAVAVYAEDGELLLPPSRSPREAHVEGHAALLTWTRVRLRRDADGTIWVGNEGTREMELVGAGGRIHIVVPQNHSPAIPPVRVEGDVLRLTYPHLAGRQSESTRVELAMPRESVVRVREAREPWSTGGALVVLGVILAAGGSFGIAQGIARSGLSAGTRSLEIGLGSVLVAGGLIGIATDLYGILTPRAERTWEPASLAR